MPAPVSSGAALWVAQRPPAELVAQAIRGPASPADIQKALQSILGQKLAATLKGTAPIAPRDLDSRLTVGDAVRIALLERIGNEAARQEREQSPMDRMNNLLQVMTGGPDRSLQRIDAATQAAMRSERLHALIGLSGPGSERLDGVRAQVDAFIRAHHPLIGKP
jgi:hypothetical protein